MRNQYVSLFAFAGLVAASSVGGFACSAATPVAAVATADAGTKDAATAKDGATAAVDAGPVEGSSCALAIAADLGAEQAGDLDLPGKKVFYAFDVKAGDFLLLSASTAATADTGEEIVDTAISLYSADGSKLLANLDDAFPRYTTDAEFYYRATADAKLCARVSDFATWSGAASVVATDTAYKFLAAKIDPASAVVTFDTEPNDTNAAPQLGKLKAFATPPGAFSYVMGVLGAAGDIDTFKFTVPPGATSIGLSVPPVGAPLAEGKSSYGSTIARFALTVKKLDGTIIAEISPPVGDAEKTTDGLTAPVAAGDYLVTIRRPDGVAAGANDFYATTLTFGGSNPVEAEVLGANSNDSIATAQALTMKVDAANAKLRDGYILAYLPAGDVADHFSFPVIATDKVSLSCSALRNGSGLTDFSVEVFIDGTSKQSETEVATKDILWATPAAGSTSTAASKPGITGTAGTAVVKLAAAGRSTTNLGTYYLCGVHIAAP